MASAAPAVPFVRDLADHGTAPALVTATDVLSYEHVSGLVDQVARSLGEHRRLVLVVLDNDVDGVVGYLGAMAGGHVALLTDAEHAAELTVAYDPDVVLRGTRVEERHPTSAHDLHPELALLLSTSGSTGSAKLVRLSHANLEANAASIAGYLGLGPGDVGASTLPLHYCYGLSILHSHLAVGASVLLTDLSVVDPCFWDAARRRGVTGLAGVPYTFDLLDRSGFDRGTLPSLRYVTQAGGRMAPATVRRYASAARSQGWDLVVMYGQTEATARMAYLPPDLAVDRPGAVGVAVPGGTLTVEPVDGAPDGVGELVYSGPNVMLGYARSPADLALGRVVDRLRTGDLGRIADDGLVEITGRRNRIAKLYGLRLDLDHLESLLDRDGTPAYLTASDDVLVAHTEDAGADPLSRVRAHTGLPPGAVLVRAGATIPRLASGKVDRAALAREAEPARTARAAESPRAPAPGRPSPGVRALYAELLARPDASGDDTFVGLGGDSLRYVEVSIRLEELLGDLPSDWHLRTIDELDATARRARGWSSVETSIALRAAAIVAIVGTHGNLFDVVGGAHVLIALLGFTMARFRLAAAPRRERVTGLVRSAVRIAVPSVLWIGAVAAVTGQYPAPTVALVNGWFGPRSWSEPEWVFWFIEVAVGLLLVTAALVAVPGFDRLERRWPFAVPLAIACLALLTRYEVVGLAGGDVIHRTHVLLWLFALGWAAARASRLWQQLVVATLGVVTLTGFFDDPPARPS